MGLLGGMARTAVVAGTATAVSNRVSRRQGNRWARRTRRHTSSSSPSTRRRPRRPAAAPAADDVPAQLEKLAQLHTSGVLSDEEFAAGKAKILGI